MKHNTRFNPTANGPLHLGHVYAMLVNERLAHESGGKFYVRFDDRSETAAAIPEWRRLSIIQQQKTDIQWLGIRVDGWATESLLMDMVAKKLASLEWPYIQEDPMEKRPYFVRLGPLGIPIHYVPQETAERVILDSSIGVTDIVRGEEFATEVSFYSFLCHAWSYDVPQFIFLPRLTGRGGVDISKTNGNYTLADIRGSGYAADDIIKIVTKAALGSVPIGWHLHNLKPYPQVDL